MAPLFSQKPLVNNILQSHSITVWLSRTSLSSFWVLDNLKSLEIAPLCGSSLLHLVLALTARHPVLPCWLGSFSISVALVRKLHHYNSHKPELSTLRNRLKIDKVSGGNANVSKIHIFQWNTVIIWTQRNKWERVALCCLGYLLNGIFIAFLFSKFLIWSNKKVTEICECLSRRIYYYQETE